MSGQPITTRPAAASDLDAICEIVEAGFESYREFLPPLWERPPLEEERSNVAARLADPATWKMVACVDAEVVGHLGFVAGRARRAGDLPTGRPDPPLVAGLAHLWQLFVAPRWWGSGAADLLHGLGLAAMERHGYERARLFTPAAHARARRFYERRGWAVFDQEHNEYLGIEMLEYRRELR